LYIPLVMGLSDIADLPGSQCVVTISGGLHDSRKAGMKCLLLNVYTWYIPWYWKKLFRLESWCSKFSARSLSDKRKLLQLALLRERPCADSAINCSQTYCGDIKVSLLKCSSQVQRSWHFKACS
jgi:hypothetical protein